MVKNTIELIKKYKLEEFLKFVVVGILATGISYFIYYIFLELTDKNIAYTLGYIISFCFNLIASHLFTFKTRVSLTNGVRFGLAHFTNYIIQIILLNFFTFVGIPKVYAPIPVYIIAIPVNFLIVRYALKRIKSYTIRNEYLEASFINIGASFTKLIDLKTGMNVIVSHYHYEDYFKNEGYLNAIIGRNAGRITNGELIIDDKIYPLTKNVDDLYQLHGGFNGFNTKAFKAEVYDSKIIFKSTSPHLEDGYPGNVSLTVTYELKGNEIHIDYEARTDQKTLLNFTNHGYFNLNGSVKEHILNHELYLNANQYIELDENNLPIKVASVKNTPFDFTIQKPIGRDITEASEQLKIAGGYDHPWLINKEKALNHVATLHSPKTNLELTIYSDQDAVVFYTGNFMVDTMVLNDKVKGYKQMALCLETQGVPNSSHIEEFKEKNIISPNEVYKQKTIWKLSQK